MRSITAYILKQNFVVEELQGKDKDIILCYGKRSIWNRFRLWLSQKIRPEITAVIPVAVTSDEDARHSLIDPPGSRAIPISEYEKNCQDNSLENKESLIQEDTCQEELG